MATIIGSINNDNLIGDIDDDTIYGLEGNDTLNGGDGIDTLIGGLGGDTYYINDLSDVITENLNEGIDNIHVLINTVGGNYTLGANIEIARLDSVVAYDLTGNALNNNLYGNAFANTLYGLEGQDYLDGGTGNDTLIGGLGDDTYIIDVLTDVVTETSTLTTEMDLVYVQIATANGTYTLGANVESAYLQSAVAYNLTGNALDNILFGNAFANTLYGLDGQDYLYGSGGIDTMIGGLGNDTYHIDDLNEIVTENLNQGLDVVVVNIATVNGTYTLAANVENAKFNNQIAYNLTGNALANNLMGNSNSNILNGLAGSDTMSGGLGNDIYIIDVLTDYVDETSTLATEIDLVNVAIATVNGTYTLFVNVENATLINTVAYNLTGNVLDNVLTGNAAANILNGSTGADTMTGGLGNDTYKVDNALDVINETSALATEIDTVESSISYVLGSNLEKLTLAAGVTNINATGNTLANTLTGNGGSNILDGLTGNDTMIGGLGNDIYTIDVLTDVVTETSTLATEIDLVNVAIATVNGTYTLGTNVENATLINTVAYNLTGNTLANTLTGNAEANILTGGAGKDTLTGNLGADIFDFNASTESVVGVGRDVIVDFSNAQGDKIDLSTIDANTLLAADQAFVATILTTGAFTAAGQLRLVGDILSGNTDSNFATSEFEIQLTGVSSLTSLDFVL
jgi:serralysin